MKKNNRGSMDLDMIGLNFMVGTIGVLILVFVYFFITIKLPLETAKRDYLIANPEMIVVSEYQRGGELPEINVNIKEEDKNASK